MSDDPFQRPASVERPATTSWPHTSPGRRGRERRTPEVSGTDDDPPSMRRGHGPQLWIVIALAGFLVGGMTAVALSALYFAEPEPLSITADTFPEYILGLERVDIQDGSGVTRSQLDLDVATQLDHFQFAYGGEGAAVDYGGGLTLTIVNGRLTPGLPSEDGGELGDGSLRLISLESEDVKCVFVPVVGLYESAVLATPRDLKASGLTDCVLVDPKRNLSLRLVNHTDSFRGDAVQAATKFAGVLERTHAGLID